MERYPGLKFVLSHCGAFTSHYFARIDHAYGARPDCREYIHRKPTEYLKKFYFDTLVFSVEQLEFLIRLYGAGHVLLGTDYPFDMGEYDPVEHVYQVEGLSEADRERICGLNALDLMGVKASDVKSRA
jgi:aminocarboxymuconate-semialdehyde decarboxylase